MWFQLLEIIADNWKLNIGDYWQFHIKIGPCWHSAADLLWVEMKAIVDGLMCQGIFQVDFIYYERYIWFLGSWLLFILGLGLHSLPCVWGTSRRVVPLHSTFFQYLRLSEGLRTSNAASSFEQQNWVSLSDLPKLRLVGIEIHHAWYPSTFAERKYLQTSTKQDSTTMLQIFLPRYYIKKTAWFCTHNRDWERRKGITHIYALLRSKMDLSGRFRMDHSTL